MTDKYPDFRITHQPLRNAEGLFWLLIDKNQDKTPGRLSSDDLLNWISSYIGPSTTTIIEGGEGIGPGTPTYIPKWITPTNIGDSIAFAALTGIGIGTDGPTDILTLGGESTRTFRVERNPNPESFGSDLCIQSGGATWGMVNSHLLYSGGYGYVVGDTVNFLKPAGGQSMVIEVTGITSPYGIENVTIDNGGTGYDPGEYDPITEEYSGVILTIVQDGGSDGKILCSVVNGVVTSVISIIDVGSGYSIGDHLSAVDEITGLGKWVRFNITALNGPISTYSIVSKGSQYTTGIVQSISDSVHGTNSSMNVQSVYNTYNGSAGNLILETGIPTGTGEAEIQFWTSPKGINGRLDGVILQRGVFSSKGYLGVDILDPISTTDFVGSVGRSIDTKVESEELDLLSTVYTILVSAVAGVVTTTLPDATTVGRRIYRVKAIDKTYDVIVNTSGEPIDDLDGAAGITFADNYDCYEFQSDGVQWWIISMYRIASESDYNHWHALYGVTNYDVHSLDTLEFIAGSNITLGLDIISTTLAQLTINAIVDGFTDTNTHYTLPVTDLEETGITAAVITLTDDDDPIVEDPVVFFSADPHLEIHGISDTAIQYVLNMQWFKTIHLSDGVGYTWGNSDISADIMDDILEFVGDDYIKIETDTDHTAIRISLDGDFDNYNYWTILHSAVGYNIYTTDNLELIEGEGISISLARASETLVQATIVSSIYVPEYDIYAEEDHPDVLVHLHHLNIDLEDVIDTLTLHPDGLDIDVVGDVITFTVASNPGDTTYEILTEDDPVYNAKLILKQLKSPYLEDIVELTGGDWMDVTGGDHNLTFDVVPVSWILGEDIYDYGDSTITPDPIIGHITFVQGLNIGIEMNDDLDIIRFSTLDFLGFKTITFATPGWVYEDSQVVADRFDDTLYLEGDEGKISIGFNEAHDAIKFSCSLDQIVDTTYEIELIDSGGNADINLLGYREDINVSTDTVQLKPGHNIGFSFTTDAVEIASFYDLTVSLVSDSGFVWHTGPGYSLLLDQDDDLLRLVAGIGIELAMDEDADAIKITNKGIYGYWSIEHDSVDYSINPHDILELDHDETISIELSRISSNKVKALFKSLITDHNTIYDVYTVDDHPEVDLVLHSLYPETWDTIRFVPGGIIKLDQVAGDPHTIKIWTEATIVPVDHNTTYWTTVEQAGADVKFILHSSDPNEGDDDTMIMSDPNGDIVLTVPPLSEHAFFIKSTIYKDFGVLHATSGEQTYDGLDLNATVVHDTINIKGGTGVAFSTDSISNTLKISLTPISTTDSYDHWDVAAPNGGSSIHSYDAVEFLPEVGDSYITVRHQKISEELSKIFIGITLPDDPATYDWIVKHDATEYTINTNNKLRFIEYDSGIDIALTEDVIAGTYDLTFKVNFPIDPVDHNTLYLLDASPTDPLYGWINLTPDDDSTISTIQIIGYNHITVSTLEDGTIKIIDNFVDTDTDTNTLYDYYVVKEVIDETKDKAWLTLDSSDPLEDDDVVKLIPGANITIVVDETLQTVTIATTPNGTDHNTLYDISAIDYSTNSTDIILGNTDSLPETTVRITGVGDIPINVHYVNDQIELSYIESLDFGIVDVTKEIPEENLFTWNSSSVEADSVHDVLHLVAGEGISLVTDFYGTAIRISSDNPNFSKWYLNSFAINSEDSVIIQSSTLDITTNKVGTTTTLNIEGELGINYWTRDSAKIYSTLFDRSIWASNIMVGDSFVQNDYGVYIGDQDEYALYTNDGLIHLGDVPTSTDKTHFIVIDTDGILRQQIITTSNDPTIPVYSLSAVLPIVEDTAIIRLSRTLSTDVSDVTLVAVGGNIHLLASEEGDAITISVDAALSHPYWKTFTINTSGGVYTSTSPLVADIVNDTLNLVAGIGIDLKSNTSLDAIQIKSTVKTFKNIAVSQWGNLDPGYIWGSTNVVAGSIASTLTFVEGDDIVKIQTDPLNSAVKIYLDGELGDVYEYWDIKSSPDNLHIDSHDIVDFYSSTDLTITKSRVSTHEVRVAFSLAETFVDHDTLYHISLSSDYALDVHGNNDKYAQINLTSIPTTETDSIIIKAGNYISISTNDETGVIEITGLPLEFTLDGTVNAVAKFTGTGSTIGDSNIVDTGTHIGFFGTSSEFQIELNVNEIEVSPTSYGVNINGDLYFRGLTNMDETGLYVQNSSNSYFIKNSTGSITSAIFNVGSFGGVQLYNSNKLMLSTESDRVHVYGFLTIDKDFEFNKNQSDIRLKSDIFPITNALELVRKMNPIWYTKDGLHDYGFIAQEIEQILPEMVQYRSDGYLGLYYDHFVAFLAKGEQELDSEIEGLKSTINALEQRIKDLEDANV